MTLISKSKPPKQKEEKEQQERAGAQARCHALTDWRRVDATFLTYSWAAT
ncbi:hypothetical protein PZN02_005336 [Sinorhizobium garamanticum]|uniref:Transposase n=1 Tax=Sinorhizobium garamanticum TaxID=680247 RepID=A0ABY8DGH7_9HYPH|nr:hypothetical protein [Sinorhizobium garamanticum]WEX89994.1 hypothetical protein PZN02_005336 [Sinorhizobium garamanticum]